MSNLTAQARKKLFISLGVLAVAALILVPISIAVNSTPGTSPSGSEVNDNNSGSPVGPTKKIILCHDGHTIRVDEHAVAERLSHGDTLGPCAEDVVICDKGNQTRIVSESQLPAYLAHGATLGPCKDKVFMCNNLGHTIVVDADRVDEHLALGHKLGLCDGFKLICFNGRTIRVTDKAAERYLAKGAYLGYCLGGQGPLISSNQIPQQVPP